jgi:ribosome-associated protein
MPVPPRRRAAPADPVDHDDVDASPDAPFTEPASAPAVDYHDVFDSRPSKTRRKKESHDLQDLGQALVEMPDKRLVGLPMDESLLDAIRVYRHTRSFEGRRRQMQYIGKLMRRADPEPLREAVAAMQLGRAQDSLALHQAEHWRVVLIADDQAIDRWLAEFPGSDLQQLRSLVRAARKDAAAAPEQRNGRGYRELFQFIKPWLLDAAGQPAHADDGDAGDSDD